MAWRTPALKVSEIMKTWRVGKSSMMKIVVLISLLLPALALPGTGLAATLVVLEARSSTLTLGMRIDSSSVIALKDLYDLLEKVIDRCRDLGNIVFHIVLKNS